MIANGEEVITARNRIETMTNREKRFAEGKMVWLFKRPDSKNLGLRWYDLETGKQIIRTCGTSDVATCERMAAKKRKELLAQVKRMREEGREPVKIDRRR